MKTTVTKKQIKEKTTTYKGEGWNPFYSFKTDINNMQFEKPIDGPVYLTVYNEEIGRPFTKEIGWVDNKNEYIQLIYDYIND